MCYENFRNELLDTQKEKAREDLEKEQAPQMEPDTATAMPVPPNEDWESEIEPAFGTL